ALATSVIFTLSLHDALPIYVFVEIGAVLYLGALTLYSLLDIPISTSVLILAVATGIYTILGGLRAVVWTEMLQLIVLLSGMVVLDRKSTRLNSSHVKISYAV